MSSFADCEGRRWQVRVTAGTLLRVSDLCGVDLLEAVGGPLMERILSEPAELCRIVAAVCRPEADRRGISEADFLDSLAGDSVAQARDALMEAVVDFFPSPQERRARGTLLAEMRRAIAKAMAEMETQFSEERVRSLVESGDTSTSSPASSASTLSI